MTGGTPMKKEKRVINLDPHGQGVIASALNRLRNNLIEEQRSTDAVDDLLLKPIDAPGKKQERRRGHEAR